MRNYKRKCFIFCLIVALFFPLCMGFSFFYKNAEQQTNLNEKVYISSVNKLAKNVNFSTDLNEFYQPLNMSSQITIYNFLAVVRFKNEDEIMQNKFPGTDFTYYQMLQKMYNDENSYSVKNYYKEVSNNKINLETVFVFDDSSLLLSKTRNTYGNKLLNNNVGYDPQSYFFYGISTRNYLEYTLYNEICGQAIGLISSNKYQEIADYNDDNIVDSFSVILLPDQSSVNVGWGDLLWAHSVSVPFSIVNNVAGILGIDVTNFKYSYNNGSNTVTKYISTFMLTTLENSLGERGLPDNNTDIHELGHVLGFPDYYIYNRDFTGTDLEDETWSVGIWDIMGYNHLNYAQYPLSYNRFLQGWIGEENVTEIKKNGNYILKPVSYEKITNQPLSSRTIAYKIKNPNRETESIWFEFRLQMEGTFENNKNIMQDGLLVYRVDEGFQPAIGYENMLSAGNFAAAPYNVYVFRNNLNHGNALLEHQFAPLNMKNSSMGDGKEHDLGYYNISGVAKNVVSTSQNLTWQVYEGNCQSSILSTNVSYEDSGIKIEIVSLNQETMEICFNVEWEGFDDTISRSEIEDSNLYNALLNLANKQQDELLKVDDFDNFISIDLSNLKISSLKGLELFSFENLSSIDLSGNNIADISSLKKIVLQHNQIVINLNNNKIDLGALSLDELNCSNFVFLIQQYNFEDGAVLFNQTISILCYLKQSDLFYFNVKINGKSLSPMTNIVHSFSNAQAYSFEVEANSSVFSSTFNKSLNIVKIRLGIDNMEIERNSAIPNLVFEGMDNELFFVSYTDFDTSTITSTPLTVTYTIIYKLDSTYHKTLTYSFVVVDTTPPVVKVLGEEKIEVLYNQQIELPAKEIEIEDNGDMDLNFNFVANPQANDVNIWTKKYYKASFDKVLGYVKGEMIDFIDTSKCGNYIIEYEVKDIQGNIGYAKRVIVVNSNIIDKSLFEDQNLYNKIRILAGTEYVYETSLIEFDFVDLSSSQINSLVGLDNLLFKKGSRLDLSNNSIQDTTILERILEKSDIEKINLIFNDINSITLNSKFIFGFQGLKKETYLAKEFDSLQYNLINDFEEYYTLETSLDFGFNDIKNLGEYEIAFSSIGAFASKTYRLYYFDYVKSSDSIEIEVKSQLDIEDYFKITGVDYTHYELEVNGDKIEANELMKKLFKGQLTLKIFVKDSLLCILDFNLNIIDTTSPVISLIDSPIIYLKKSSNYEEYGCNIFDNYDTPNLIIEGEVHTDVCGKYLLTYYAVDNSGNESNHLERVVYVGNVAFDTDILIEYNTEVNVVHYLFFEQFSINDFIIKNQANIDTTKLGTQAIWIQLEHKTDSSLTFDLSSSAKIVDTTKPVINLIGGIVKLYVLSDYIEPGFAAFDNFDKDITSKTVISTNLDTSEVGEYSIFYNVADSSGNKALQVVRKVIVIYRPITFVNIKNTAEKISYKIGEEVNFLAQFSELDETINNMSSVLIWSVDGVEVSRGVRKDFSYTFKDKGKHEIVVSVLNEQLQGEMSQISSEVYNIQIEDFGFIDRYGTVLIVSAIAFVFLVIILAFYFRRRNRFFQ